MSIVLNITAESAEELSQIVIELAARKGAGAPPAAQVEPSVEELLATLRAKLASQNLTVVVKGKTRDSGNDKASEWQTTTEAEAEPMISIPAEESIVAAGPSPLKKKSNGGGTKIPKEVAAAVLDTETPAGRKARCVAELQTLFANGRKSEVLKILAELGNGAKTFGAVPEENFAAISDALVTMGVTHA